MYSTHSLDASLELDASTLAYLLSLSSATLTICSVSVKHARRYKTLTLPRCYKTSLLLTLLYSL
jgi:hypothetical protein